MHFPEYQVEYYLTAAGRAPFRGAPALRGRQGKSKGRHPQGPGILGGLSEENAVKTNKMPSYKDDLLRRLKDPEYAVGYLNAAFEDPHPNVFLLALRDVTEAWGGMTKLSRKARIPRISLYRMLSRKGNPQIHSLDAVLRAFGLRFAVVRSPARAAD